MRVVAHDSGVPLYRPTVRIAESQMTLAGMQVRVNWMKQHAYGKSIKATVKVQGFRQSDGTLWRANQIVSCTIPWLAIDADLLIVRVKFVLDDKTQGHVTELEIGPVEGFTPDPTKTAKHKGGGKGSGGISLAGLGGR
jgi:prophage tail gpP-like protein